MMATEVPDELRDELAHGWCPNRSDATHCTCWWVGGPCCSCGNVDTPDNKTTER